MNTMTRNIIHFTMAALALCAALPSCTGMLEEEGHEFESCGIAVGCEIPPMGGTEDAAGTKTSMASSDIEDKLTGVSLAAYDASGKLERTVHFTEGFTRMSLPVTLGGTYTVCALANMGDMTGKFPGKVSQLGSLTHDLGSMADVDRDGLPMSGKVTGYAAVRSGSLTIPMKRLFAKVTVHADLLYYGEGDNTVCGGMSVRNLNRHLTPFGVSRARGAEDIMTESEGDGHLTVRTTPGSLTGVFYVPENMQGKIGSASQSWQKNPDEDEAVKAASARLTHFESRWTVIDAKGEYSGEVTYRTYLGSNATNNFSVEGNWKYVMDLRYRENSLAYDDWQVDNGVEDCRHLWFRTKPIYVEKGDRVLCADVLDMRMDGAKVEHAFSTEKHMTSHDGEGITIRPDAARGSSFLWTVRAANNNDDDHLKDQATVIVTRKASKLELTPNPVELERGEQDRRQLTATATFKDGTANVTADAACVFSVVEGGDKASVSQNGLVTGTAVGEAIVKATYTYQTGLPPVEAVCVVKVRKPAVKSVSLVTKGTTNAAVTAYRTTDESFDVDLSATATLRDGTKEAITGELLAEAVWSGAHTSWATGISKNGKPYASVLEAGHKDVAIYLTYGGVKSNAYKVSTCSAVMEPLEFDIPQGDSHQFKVRRVNPSGGVVTESIGTWKTEDQDKTGSSYASVGDTGLVQAHAEGISIVTNEYVATDGGHYSVTGIARINKPSVVGDPVKVERWEDPITVRTDDNWAVSLTPAASEAGAAAGTADLTAQGSHRHTEYTRKKYRHINKFTWTNGDVTYSNRSVKPYEAGAHYRTEEIALSKGAWTYDPSKDETSPPVVTTVTTDQVSRASNASWISAAGAYQKNTGTAPRTATLSATNTSAPEGQRPVAQASVTQAGNALTQFRLCALNAAGTGEVTNPKVEWGESLRIGGYAEYSNGDKGYTPVGSYGEFSLGYAGGAPAYFGSFSGSARTLTPSGSGAGTTTLKGTMSYGGTSRSSELAVKVFMVQSVALRSDDSYAGPQMSGSAPEFTCSMHRQVQLKAVVTYTDGSTATLAPGRYGGGSEAWSVVAKPTQVTITSTGKAGSIGQNKAVQGGKFRLTLTPYRSLDASKVFVGECTGNFENDAWLSGATVQMNSSHDGWISVPKFSHTQDPLINSGNRYTIENTITAALEDITASNILYKVYAHQYETEDALLYQGTGRAVYVEMYETHPYGYDYPYGGIKSFITGTYGPWGESETVTVASDRMAWYPGM